MDLGAPQTKDSTPDKMTTLLDFIYHAPVGAPTYFDVLPVDVLRHALIPFLGWEDRIHLNMLTPPGDRTPPNKIPKSAIAAHQLAAISRSSIEEKLRKLRFIQLGRGRKLTDEVNALIEVMDTVTAGHNILICQYSLPTRVFLEQRIEFFSRPAEMRRIPRVEQKDRLRAAMSTLSLKLHRNPLIENSLAKKTWLRATVHTNETALFSAGGDSTGVSYMRWQGDIYTEQE
jgi:hypothetical protein